MRLVALVLIALVAVVYSFPTLSDDQMRVLIKDLMQSGSTEFRFYPFAPHPGRSIRFAY